LKIKRHTDAVVSLYSVDGLDGDILISGSADHTCRIWNMKDLKITKRIEVGRPSEEELYKNLGN
jgi:WD40 repeat protein